MDITHKYHHKIRYELTVTHVADRLSIKMEARDLRSSKKFEKVVDQADQLGK